MASPFNHGEVALYDSPIRESGRILVSPRGAGQGAEFADQRLEIATPTDSRKYLARGWRLKREIALTRRQWGEAESALREALAIAEAIGNPPQLWRTHVARARLHAEAKRSEQARLAYQAAREVIDRVKGSLRDPALRAGFESAPQIRQVFDLSTRD